MYYILKEIYMNNKKEEERKSKRLNFRMRQAQMERLESYRQKKGLASKGEAVRKMIGECVK